MLNNLNFSMYYCNTLDTVRNYITSNKTCISLFYILCGLSDTSDDSLLSNALRKY